MLKTPILIPDPAPVTISRLLNQKEHKSPALGLVPGYVHTTLHLALALLHDVSYVPVILGQVCYLHCLYCLHTFIISVPLSGFQVKVTGIRLQWSLLELCFIAGTCQQMFDTLGCGMRSYWWA